MTWSRLERSQGVLSCYPKRVPSGASSALPGCCKVATTCFEIQTYHKKPSELTGFGNPYFL